MKKTLSFFLILFVYLSWSLCSAELDLNFILDEEYNICYSLFRYESRKDRFEKEELKDFVEFANCMREACPQEYERLFNILRATDEDILVYGVYKTPFPGTCEIEDMDVFFEYAKSTASFQKILSEVEEYLEECRQEWLGNYEVAFRTMTEVTGIDFHREFDVYISHPKLQEGCHFADKKIAWGHYNEFPNYITVYLWHEVMHDYMKFDDVSHAVSEMAVDNHLRTVFNGGEYFPLIGHDFTGEIREAIYTEWLKYLESENKNINDFAFKMKDFVTNKKISFNDYEKDES